MFPENLEVPELSGISLSMGACSLPPAASEVVTLAHQLTQEHADHDSGPSSTILDDFMLSVGFLFIDLAVFQRNA